PVVGILTNSATVHLRDETAFAEFLQIVWRALPDAFGGVAEDGETGEFRGGGENRHAILFFVIELPVEPGDRFLDAIGDDAGGAARILELQIRKRRRAGHDEVRRLFV